MISHTRGKEDAIVHIFNLQISCMVEFRHKWKATILRIPSGFSYDLLGRLDGTYAKSAMLVIGRDPEIGFCSVLTE